MPFVFLTILSADRSQQHFKKYFYIMQNACAVINPHRRLLLLSEQSRPYLTDWNPFIWKNFLFAGAGAAISP